MADLHKFTVKEAVNFDVASVWNVQDIVTLSSDTTVHVNVTDAHTIIFDATDTLRFTFDTNASTSCTSKDIQLAAGLTTWKVPKGLGDTIYLHYARAGNTSMSVRMVLC